MNEPQDVSQLPALEDAPAPLPEDAFEAVVEMMWQKAREERAARLAAAAIITPNRRKENVGNA
jgi:hypothetical protein